MNSGPGDTGSSDDDSRVLLDDHGQRRRSMVDTGSVRKNSNAGGPSASAGGFERAFGGVARAPSSDRWTPRIASTREENVRIPDEIETAVDLLSCGLICVRCLPGSGLDLAPDTRGKHSSV